MRWSVMLLPYCVHTREQEEWCRFLFLFAVLRGSGGNGSDSPWHRLGCKNLRFCIKLVLCRPSSTSYLRPTVPRVAFARPARVVSKYVLDDPPHLTCPPLYPPLALRAPPPQVCLEHRHSYVRRNAALLCYYVHKNFGQQVTHGTPWNLFALSHGLVCPRTCLVSLSSYFYYICFFFSPSCSRSSLPLWFFFFFLVRVAPCYCTKMER